MGLHVARLALIGLVALFTAHTCQKSSNDFDDASRSAIRVVQRSSLDGNSAKKRENKLDKVLSLVQNLYSQVNTLEQRMKDIEKQQAEIDLSVICSNRQADYENGYDITNCGNKTSDQEDYFLVDATFGTWKEHGFCRVFQTKKLHKKCYVVTAHMFNVMTEKDVNHGYIGLAYNIKNNENFDFVILRLHRKNSCYQTGYMENGKLRLTEFNGNCPDGPPNGHTWFKMQVFVRDNEAQLYLNDKPVVSFTSHLSPIGRGGVIVAAGVNSVIRIRGLDVAAVEPFFFSFYNCKSHQMIRDQFYILSAPFGTFPDSGFCRAISKQRISGTNYIITARMFNENLYPGSKVGLMFNAQDPYNFDFVNFQVDSVGGCYETGFVQNSRINYISTKKGPCPSGPFKTATWHNVTVYVKGDQVSILLDGERIISTKGHFPTRAVGGVVVSSGTDNSASFKDFKLSPTAPNAFELEGCSPHSRLAPNYHVLDAKHGKWSLDGFCRAISRKTVSESNYIVSTELFIHVKHLARDKKIFVGLAFNSKDTSNFDFVYVRPHTHGYCYRLGFVMNGVVQFPIWQEGKCPGRRPKTGKWFKISVAIFESMAVVKLNGIHLVTYESHYRGVSKGGVIVSNGGDNELTFRNFKLNSIKPLKFKFSHCGKRTHKNNGHYTMDGTLGHWPRDGFCTALPHYTADVSFMEYSVLVKLKIVECMVVIDSRNAGLMFNAVDENNYEYVYISIHNKESCFQFGSVVGGEIKEKKQNSGPCVGKIPKQGDWFSLRVHVSHDSRATFYVDNIATGKFASSSIWHPYGGILVPHGYRNIVMFREFLTFPRFR